MRGVHGVRCHSVHQECTDEMRDILSDDVSENVLYWFILCVSIIIM